MLTTKIDLGMKKLENLGLDHLKMVDAQVTCEECGEMDHMGINCPTVPQDVHFIGNSNNGFCPNQGFNAGWNKPSFPFDNHQQGGMRQNFNRSEFGLFWKLARSYLPPTRLIWKLARSYLPPTGS
jgi:hypothetical protein